MKHVIVALLTIIGITSIAGVILDYLAYRSDEANKPTEHENMCPYFVEPHETDSAVSRVCPCEVANMNNSEDKDE